MSRQFKCGDIIWAKSPYDDDKYSLDPNKFNQLNLFLPKEVFLKFKKEFEEQSFLNEYFQFHELRKIVFQILEKICVKRTALISIFAINILEEAASARPSLVIDKDKKDLQVCKITSNNKYLSEHLSSCVVYDPRNKKKSLKEGTLDRLSIARVDKLYQVDIEKGIHVKMTEMYFARVSKDVLEVVFSKIFRHYGMVARANGIPINPQDFF